MPLAIEPSMPPVVTRHNGGENALTVTRHKKPKLPKDHGLERPPKIEGYHWRKKGAGWELRKDVYIEENGVRMRKQPYTAHLSRTAFQELKRANKGAALEKALSEWVSNHDR